jgi:glycosyltransferase involved in cell wall biosynthesis
VDYDLMNIIFFIGSLRMGGKERRLIDLLSYLRCKPNYRLMVILKYDKIDYPHFFKLNIPHQVLKTGSSKQNPLSFIQFYRICRVFKPDIIHAWGRMPAFYSLLTVILKNITLVNSQITSTPPVIKKISIYNVIDRINFRFSNIILSNSITAMEAYRPVKNRSRVIYNGINPDRFSYLQPIERIKAAYGITTPYVVVMVASFTPNKNYDLFFRVAEYITALRSDISFIGVGDWGRNDAEYRKMVKMANNKPRIFFPGKVNDVESLIQACDIGVLFTNNQNHGEGISNAILEYMALCKPVIANDSGGTREIVHNNINGYLITSESVKEISNIITGLLDDRAKREMLGKTGRRIVEEYFMLDKMGQAYENIYHQHASLNGK